MPSRNEIQIEISAQDNASGPLGDVGSALSGIGKVAVAGAAALVGATVAIGGGLLDMARDAAPVEGITNAFKALAKSAGQDSDALIAHMTKMSMGLVDDGDLMRDYTTSAQLMGAQLAGQLPDAYQYLAKVASASGQDVGQMMETLVSGVGRVTPKMMTQLGVTLDMEQITSDYAKSVGKTSDQLTKADKQTAIFNATMAALKKNTAAMPDITNNASTKMQQFHVKFEDMKETLGTALLPMLGTFMDLLSGLADRIFPIITPIVETLGSGFTAFFQALSDGVNPLTALGDGIYKVFGEGARPVLDFITNFTSLLEQLFSSVGTWVTGQALPALSRFSAWFTQDALPAVVNFVQGTVIPGIQTLFTFLSNAWATIAPGLQRVADWFLTDALPKVKNFVENEVRPALDKVFGWLGRVWDETISPGLTKLKDWFLTDALPKVKQFVEVDFKNALDKVFGWLGKVWDENIKPGLDKLKEWFLTTGLPAVQNFVENTFKPALDTVFGWLGSVWDSVILPGLTKLHDWFTTGGLQEVINSVQNFFTHIGQLPGKIQEWIDKQGFLAQRLEDFIAAIGIGIVVFGIYNGLVAAAGVVSTAAAAGIGAMRAATALMLGPLGLAIIAITTLIALYHQLQTFQQQVSTAVQTSISPTAQAIRNGLTHDQYMDRAFASTVSQMGDAAARIFWGNGGQTLFERTWQAAYAEANPASRDSGGPGRAGNAYMIGKGAQPEMFIPSTSGTFIPNADKMMGGSSVNVQSLVIHANDAAGGSAAGEAFLGVLDEWQSRGNR